MCVGSLSFRFGYRCQDRVAPLQIPLARLGERYPARRPIQQTSAQMRLEFGDRTGNISRRGAKLRGRGSEARALGHLDEYLHVSNRIHALATLNKLTGIFAFRLAN